MKRNLIQVYNLGIDMLITLTVIGSLAFAAFTIHDPTQSIALAPLLVLSCIVILVLEQFKIKGE